MKGKMSIARIAVLALCAVFTMCIGIGFFWNPQKMRFDVPREDDLLEVLEVNSSTITHSIDVNDAGEMILNGEDCYFEFDNIEHPGYMIVLRFNNEMPGITNYVTALDYGDGFEEAPEQLYYAKSLRYTDCACLELPTNKYVGVRIRPLTNLSISSVEIHEQKHIDEFRPIPHSTKKLICGCIAGILLTFLLGVLEWKTSFSKAVVDWMAENKRYLAEDVLVLAGSIVTTIVLKRVVHGGAYTFTYNVMVVTVICCIFVLLRNSLICDFPVERTFFVLVMLMGTLYILGSGPSLSWDAFEHYRETIQSTNILGEVGLTDGDLILLNMGMIPEGSTYLEVLSMVNKNAIGITDWIGAQFHISRSFGAVGLNLVNLFGFEGYIGYYAGRFSQLLAYALCGYFGIKRLHSGKMIYAVISAIPVNLFLATNYSDDYVVTGFTMLGMAYFVGMCQEVEEDVNIKDTIIMLSAFVIGCLPKQVYLPILIFPFLMSVKKTKNKKKLYYTLCVIAMVIMMVSLYGDAKSNLTGTGDPRGVGDAVDPMGQVSFIFSHPVWYTGVMLRYIWSLLNPFTTTFGTFFAYAGTATGYGIIVALLAFVTLCDKTDADRGAYSPWIRIYSVLHFIGVAALVTTALYIVFSGVGSDYMGGAQPRYYVPLFYPLCAVVTGRGISVKKYIPDRIFNTVVLAISFYVCFHASYTVLLPWSMQ